MKRTRRLDMKRTTTFFAGARHSILLLILILLLMLIGPLQLAGQLGCTDTLSDEEIFEAKMECEEACGCSCIPDFDFPGLWECSCI